MDGGEESLAPICKDNKVSELDTSNGRAVWYMSLSHESSTENNQKTRYWKRTAERDSKEEKSADEGTVKNQEGS